MDRNSAIGFVLIAVVLFAYFTFFAPEAPTTPPQPVTTQQVVKDSVAAQPAVAARDSAIARQYGNLAPLLNGEEKTLSLSNDDIQLQFSSKGARIRSAELSRYKTYSQQPLLLVTPSSSDFRLLAKVEGREIDLYQLYYNAEQRTVGDTTQVVFSAAVGNGVIRHIYGLGKKGYVLSYRIETEGLTQSLTGDALTYQWVNRIPLVEKDVKDSRTKTAANFYTTAGEFDGTSESSMDVETMPLPQPVRWVSFKQKFFLTAFIAGNSFSGGEVGTSSNEALPELVKEAQAKLTIPVADVQKGASFRYYLGPNDYKTLDDVSPGLRRNVYLGWPPVKWVNQYFIFPVFHFLTTVIGNYALIIVILVIILRIVLLPLTYKSYLGMAKMRLLKPELDELKAQYADDQVKFSQEQMKLFSEAGASPFSGCIPILLQMPILFAMFYLFPASIEFRQQTLWWAEDISTYDSLIKFSFDLPLLGSHISIFTLLMTASTLAITWQNNQVSTVDGPMKSMSYIMPVIFLFMLNSFPASLSFYYLVANVFSFGQQYLIKRFVDEEKIKKVMEDHRKKSATGTSGKSKFMSRLEEAMKAGEEARKKRKS
ncbi:MAG: membrane protein insertase YidC [Cyclobacteriaceae bacterium]|nr:membrane protein insertase YidC [Cyclobacteriaceae bacterium]